MAPFLLLTACMRCIQGSVASIVVIVGLGCNASTPPGDAETGDASAGGRTTGGMETSTSAAGSAEAGPSTDQSTDSSGSSTGTSGDPTTRGTTGATGPDAESSSGSTGGEVDCPGLDAFDCAPCDLVVPDDAPTISDAILDSSAPGLVCVRAGDYEESITLRPHVSVRGVGPQTRIIGQVSLVDLPDPDPTPTVVSDLTVGNSYGGFLSCPPNNQICNGNNADNYGLTIALTIERTIIEPVPGIGTTYCLWYTPFGGSTNLTVRDSECHSNDGLRLVPRANQPETISIDILIERNVITPGVHDWIGGPVDVLPELDLATEDSHYDVTIRNNSMERTWGPAFYITTSPAWPSDASITLAHNTAADATGLSIIPAAIWHDGPDSGGPPLHVANNLFHEYEALLEGVPLQTEIGNLLVEGAFPFVSIEDGDFHLLDGAGAIDAGAPGFADDDFDGDLRPLDGDGDGSAVADIGFDEYDPDEPEG